MTGKPPQGRRRAGANLAALTALCLLASASAAPPEGLPTRVAKIYCAQECQKMWRGQDEIAKALGASLVHGFNCEVNGRGEKWIVAIATFSNAEKTSSALLMPSQQGFDRTTPYSEAVLRTNPSTMLCRKTWPIEERK